MKLLTVLVVLFLSSCNGVKTVPMEEKNIEDIDKGSKLELLMRKEGVGFDTEELVLIRDEKRLRSFFSKVNRTRKPRLPVPIIDFSKEMVVIECNAKQNQNGMASLYLVNETDSQVILNSRTDKMDVNKASVTVMSRPFCVYKMPITSKEIVLK